MSASPGERARPPAQRRGLGKSGGDEALGRSRGGLGTKMHTLADATGHPFGRLPTGGHVHDPLGADHLLTSMQAAILIADKACDADARVLLPLAAAGGTARNVLAGIHLTATFIWLN